MNRFVPKSLVKVLLLFIAVGVARPQRAEAYPQAGGSLQAAKPCSLVTKAEAESIVGASLVVRRNTDDECWYVESGFTDPAGPRNRQVFVNIWRSATPQRDDVSTTRANIAARQRTAVTRDVPGFADAALWTWTPGAGRLDAFKGGTIGVDVMVGGIAEGAALQHAKVLAARALGGAAKTGFAYEGVAAATKGIVLRGMEIRQFDRMSGDDQIGYIDKMIDKIEEACKDDPAKLAQVELFFRKKQPGEAISGMGRFELSLSLARVADLQAAEKNPKARRLEVEDVMYVALGSRGIVINRYFRPAYQPKKPLAEKFETLEGANETLKQTKAWVARTVTVEPEHSFSHGGPSSSVPGFANDAMTIRFFNRLGIHDMTDTTPINIPTPEPDKSHDGIPCYLVGGTVSQRIDKGCY